MPRQNLSSYGLADLGQEYWHLHSPALYEHIVRRGEGLIADGGPIVVRTGTHTGRAPKDKFFVEEDATRERIAWGDVNRSIAEHHFDALFGRITAYLRGKDVYVQDLHAGAHPRHGMHVRVVTEYAWHSLFARNLFIKMPDAIYENFVPDYTIVCAPGCRAVPETDGTNSETFVVIHFGKRLVLIGGTSYAGEIKKSVFTLLNFLLPQEGVMPMHCSANLGNDGASALFFGLSGTGKTTLSADEHRRLIGDDEHGWADDGIFNFEGGCYAKMIRLSREGEPQIWEATRSFSTVLENVVIDEETRVPDLDDDSLTENTRGAYSLARIPGALIGGVHAHPKDLVMLTCDAFGIMPPIARMSTEQAMYHFLSGYTAKVAGTEKGLSKDPQATFSTCFGAPFMVLPPTEYAELLRTFINKHNTRCWIVNTGWTGGPYGVGQRMKLAYTRALVNAALDGKLEGMESVDGHLFGMQVPREAPGVPSSVLNPRDTWPDTKAYDRKAAQLADLFRENFKKFSGAIADEVAEHGPRV
ncbi:MAG: phosphoenolpyruvate carboxykinase (ATP) [Deltaproteobacteria bacterium]|nr:phosphoenolpyruvate carboxykinase (ATP) [Deltaproteobacteria bacterium]